MSLSIHDARPAGRILVLDPKGRLLLLQATRYDDGHVFWLAPGGGLMEGESFEVAAVREVVEETGLSVELGPCVWTRLHEYEWGGRRHLQYERYFIGHTTETEVQPVQQDDYVVGHRWWTLAEIRATQEHLVPRRLAELLPRLILGDYPCEPLDCGV